MPEVADVIAALQAGSAVHEIVAAANLGANMDAYLALRAEGYRHEDALET